MFLTSSLLIDLLLGLTGLIFLLYKYSTRKYNYWKQRNIYHKKPCAFLGNFSAVFFFKKTIGDWLKDFYDSTEEPYMGIFILDEPSLLIKCPNLIKRVLIRDFASFMDRTMACPKHNELLANIMFVQKGSKWKATRSKMTPVFTSGKLKAMFPVVKTVGEDLVYYLDKHKGTIDAKKVCNRYATEIIAKCAFGQNSQCFENEDAVFMKIGEAMFDFKLRNGIVQSCYLFKENLVHRFQLDFWERHIQDYFTEVFWSTVKYRDQTNFRANDLVDMLRDMMKSDDHPGFVGDKVAAQAAQFFGAGFDTTASTIAHTLYELAINPNIQDKLRDEILSYLEEHNGLTYESLSKLKYLDMCIKETLRKYPVLPFLDRRCIKTYHVPDTNLIIEKGMPVYISLEGLHYDEKYFPESNKYIPERFSDNNINNEINGLVYIPFGEGPRSCIGERFGMLNTKVALVYSVANFKIEKCSQTPEPIVFEPKSFTLQSKVGLPLSFKKIEKTT